MIKQHLKLKLIAVFLLLSGGLHQALAGPELKGSLIFQKEHRGYWYNGMGLRTSSPALLGNRLQLELKYITSRLGTGFQEGALAQDKVDMAIGFYFRQDKMWNPYVNLVTGYYHVDTEGFDIYDSNNALTYGINLGSFLHAFPKWGGPFFDLGFTLKNGNGVTYPLNFSMGWTLNILPGLL
jgi:hypothetical protein